MKIKVKANMTIPSWGGQVNELELNNGNSCVSTLIEVISKHISFPLINPKTKEFSEWIELLINGRNCKLMPNYLEQKISRDDEIVIKFLMMGGG